MKICDRNLSLFSGLQTDARRCKKRSHSVATQFGAKIKRPARETGGQEGEGSAEEEVGLPSDSSSSSDEEMVDDEWLPDESSGQDFTNVDKISR